MKETDISKHQMKFTLNNILLRRSHKRESVVMVM